MVERVTLDAVYPDPENPRKSDDTRLHLLRLSLERLGFIQPIFAHESGLILSGHQRHHVATELDYDHIPVEWVDLPLKDIKGINVMFNRATNDFTAFDTGSSSLQQMDIGELIALAEEMPVSEYDYAFDCEIMDISELGQGRAQDHNRKSLLTASTMRRKGIQIPIVISESGEVVNGIHRLYDALYEGITEWPVVTIPDEHANLALSMLNYLSMDYEVDGEFAKMLRYSAYRRPQNNRGRLPKAFRFWANGNKTLSDSDAYSDDYWRHFRDLHGTYVCDFGAGLCKAKGYLERKGIDCLEFEPFRIRPDAETKRPDPDFSRAKAKEFLQTFADDDRQLGSIFLCSVMNSIPFPRDRQCVLAIVHAMSGINTVTYGTCRDISDFEYEYSGIRNAAYFKFDSEPGVRLGDTVANPKIQKFHTQDEFKQIASYFWNTVETWPGGNVFYFRCANPKQVNPTVLRSALEFEFDLPYSDGSTMGMVEEAVAAFETKGKL